MIYSNCEFYYTPKENISESTIKLSGEESNHAINVMRHRIGDELNISDGKGNIYLSVISHISKSEVTLNISKCNNEIEKYPHITFFIPVLKSSDRLELALEKCVELGITNFVVYSAEKSHKRGIKIERWEKIILSAMKQSLQSYLPKIRYQKSLLSSPNSKITNLIFDQLAEQKFTTFLGNLNNSAKINLFFGPEAGLTENEVQLIPDIQKVKLCQNRLRTETAIVSAAAILSSI